MTSGITSGAETMPPSSVLPRKRRKRERATAQSVPRISTERLVGVATSTSCTAIADSTVNEDDVNPKLAPEAFLQPPSDNPRGFQEAVNDYNQRKKERMPLTRRFNVSRPYVLLLPDDVAQFKAARGSPNASSDEQSTFSQYLGITFFSEVYFNTAQTAALVYILDWCGNLCSQSEWVYLEKQNGAWVRRSGKAPPQT